MGNKLTPWLPVHLLLLGETFGTFPSRFVLDQDSWLEVQHEFILNMQHSMGSTDSPARESRCSSPQQTVIVGVLPS